MSKPTFTWFADLGAQRSVKPNVQATKFGDGYELRVPTDINVVQISWALKFTRNWAELGLIDAFLIAQAGTTSFTWTDPTNNVGTFVCRKWNVTQIVFGVYELSGTFEQVFET